MQFGKFLSKSFCWGILFASLTWTITIFLYFNLTQNDAHEKFENYNRSVTTIRNFYKQLPTYSDLKGNKTLIALSNNLNPFIRLGDGNEGEKDDTVKLGIIRTIEDKHIRDFGYKQHSFNALVTNNIGLWRNIPDTRHIVCLNENYTEILPTVSIIMCFYNEHLITLLRSINTIIRRTPNEILAEIILVDDYSELSDLKIDLVNKIKEIDFQSKVKVIRNKQREGLIRSRVIGSRLAIADILVFLDSHIEVNNDWLQPLVQQIVKENSTLAVPVIDIINPDTFAYSPSPLVRGGFNWGLHFKWENLPSGTLINQSSFAGPFLSPTMAGGLFAVNRQYFKYIGEYDMGMDIWGGENIEISFRVWQCGGSIKILPCSRVGHIFRKRRPYGSTDGANTMLKNSLRLAYVWMDDFKKFYLKTQGNMDPTQWDFGNIDDRLELRKKLKCKSFSWYISNIYPELEIPGQKKKKSENLLESKVAFQPWHLRKRNYTKNFMIQLSNSTLCATVKSQKKDSNSWKRGSSLILKPCAKDKNQIFYQTDRYEFILDKLYCLEASSDYGKAVPVLGKCHEMLGNQQWRYIGTSKSSPIYNSATGTCIKASNASAGALIYLDLCAKTNLNVWGFYS